MAKDLIVKVTADASGYVKGLNEASGAHEKFKKQMHSGSSVMSAATSVLTKYVSTAALIKGAQEVITKTIQGSQTAADKFEEVMAAARTTVDNFFTSLSTGDFTSFLQGISSIISKAKEAQQALDRLGNASMSWSYFQSARTADYRDQMTVAKNTNLSLDQRQTAYAEMGNILIELNGMVEGYTSRAGEAMAKEMTKATGVAWQNVSKADLEKILRLDLMSINSSETEKGILAAQYAEYQKKVKDVAPVKVARQYTLNGSVIKEYDEADKQRRASELEALSREYQDAILYNEVLVRKSDDWLKNLISLVQQADAARRAMGELNNSYRETGNVLKKVTTTEETATPEYVSTANMGWNYFQAARSKEFQQQLEIVKNSELPIEQRQGAYDKMGSIMTELNTMMESYITNTMDAMTSEMTKTTGVSWQNITKEDLENILRLDLMSMQASEDEKTRLATLYAEYQQKVNAIEPAKIIRQYTQAGATVTEFDEEDQQRYNADLAALSNEYKDAILYNEVLTRQSDEWLNTLIALVQQIETARGAVGDMNSALRAAGANLSNDINMQADASLTVNIPENLTSNLDNVNKRVDSLTGKTSAVSELAGAFGQLGSAMSGAGGDAFTAAGAIMQAVASAAPAFVTLTSSAATAAGAEAVAETPTLAGKIAAAATITATLISLVSTLKNVGSYAEGGIIPGHNFTDGITARVSSGEMVINEADQKRLYDSIHSGNFNRGGGGNSVITGEQIVTVINSYGRRTGRGEILR